MCPITVRRMRLKPNSVTACFIITTLCYQIRQPKNPSRLFTPTQRNDTEWNFFRERKLPTQDLFTNEGCLQQYLNL